MDILKNLSYNTAKKYLGKSSFKNVTIYNLEGTNYYKAQLNKYRWSKYFLDEKEAAKAVDIKLIEKGEKPKNILKAKV